MIGPASPRHGRLPLGIPKTRTNGWAGPDHHSAASAPRESEQGATGAPVFAYWASMMTDTQYR